MNERKADRLASLSADIIHWQNGEYVASALYTLDYALLRIEGNEVVTTHGARIPLSHAIRGLSFVRRVKASGTPYKRNGHTFHLGHYAIDSIDANGNLVAGCHKIQFSEIERIAPMLESLATTADIADMEAIATM